MPGQVFTDEAGDEVIAVIVTFLQTQRERQSSRFTGRLQVVGEQLLGEKLIGCTLVDQHGWRFGAVLYQAGCIPGFPVQPLCMGL